MACEGVRSFVSAFVASVLELADLSCGCRKDEHCSTSHLIDHVCHVRYYLRKDVKRIEVKVTPLEQDPSKRVRHTHIIVSVALLTLRRCSGGSVDCFLFSCVLPCVCLRWCRAFCRFEFS